jgi:UDP-N-acetylglucosamine--N-acetylmuramyl-(pentapeptide) pyrophosphoryl-undecaprenol N-acetylglucosamine transferase
MSTNSNARIIFFTSPIGLGHASRDIAVAEKLYKLGKGKENIHFVTGQHAYELISSRGYLAYDLYEPEKFSIQSGELRHPFKWLLKYFWYYRKCKGIAKEILESHENKSRSDLIVSDEDFASIVMAEKIGYKRILITDITETHFVNGKFASMIEKMMNKSMQKMINKCDYVIIPDFGVDLGNVIHVGPIVRDVSADRKTLRNGFGFNKQTVLVSVGGTDAGQYLIEKTIEAYKKLRKKFDIDLLIVPGPSINLTGYRNEGIRILGFVNNLHEYIYASDLIISLAGRSTMDESMAYGIPGIFIPIKNHFEQEEGAKRFGYKHDDIFRLEYLIEDNLRASNSIGRTKLQANATGAERAAKLILETL